MIYIKEEVLIVFYYVSENNFLGFDEMARLAGKVALVTGAAMGIGNAIATLFAKEGAKVVVTDFNKEAGEKAVEKIRAEGGNACFLFQDASKEADWKSVMEAIKQHDGRLDILVNNAGIAFEGTVETTTLADWQRVSAVNVDGVFMGTKYAIELMKNNKEGGSIINLGSVASLIGIPALTAYCASKGSVNLFTKSVAVDCGRKGYKIRVNAICPGHIWTALMEDLQRRDKAAVDHLISETPLGHTGTPEDVAYGALYLASDESKFVTGSELVIDGGMTAG